MPTEWGLAALVFLLISAAILTYHEERARNDAERPRIFLDYQRGIKISWPPSMEILEPASLIGAEFEHSPKEQNTLMFWITNLGSGNLRDITISWQINGIDLKKYLNETPIFQRLTWQLSEDWVEIRHDFPNGHKSSKVRISSESKSHIRLIRPAKYDVEDKQREVWPDRALALKIALACFAHASIEKIRQESIFMAARKLSDNNISQFVELNRLFDRQAQNICKLNVTISGKTDRQKIYEITKEFDLLMRLLPNAPFLAVDKSGQLIFSGAECMLLIEEAD